MTNFVHNTEVFLLQPLPVVVDYAVASVVLLVLAYSTVAIFVGKKS